MGGDSYVFATAKEGLFDDGMRSLQLPRFGIRDVYLLAHE